MEIFRKKKLFKLHVIKEFFNCVAEKFRKFWVDIYAFVVLDNVNAHK